MFCTSESVRPALALFCLSVPSVSKRPISAAAAVTRGHGSVISQFNLVWEVVRLHLGLLRDERRLVSERRCCYRTCQMMCTCLRALRAIVWKAWSTLMASFALVSKYGILLLLWHQAWARFVVTCTRRSIRQYSKWTCGLSNQILESILLTKKI